MKTAAFSSSKNSFKLYNNNKFSSKFMLNYGIHLGGNICLLELSSKSVLYGVRSRNSVINVTKTSIELMKNLTIIEGLGFNKSVVYFVNSIMGFKLAFKNSFDHYNRHLFFPTGFIIDNVLKKSKVLVLNKFEKKRINRALRSKKAFLIKSGKSLLRKAFISSKWPNGFVSNSSTFFSFAHRVLYEKVKFGKMLNSFQEKLKTFVDFYPFLPNYSFVGDHRQNYWIVNEFWRAGVPTTSVIDTFTVKSLQCMFGVPGNACSVDSSMFFLILLISSYLTGFNQYVVKYSLDSFESTFKERLNYFAPKRKMFFKSFKKLTFLN